MILEDDYDSEFRHRGRPLTALQGLDDAGRVLYVGTFSKTMSRPAMSRHLRVLRRAGLIAQETLEEDARARLIQLRTEPLSRLRAWVEDVEAMWGDQLESFKAHAERVQRGRR